MRGRATFATALVALFALSGAGNQALADEAEVFQKILSQKTAPLVTVRFVLKVKTRAGENEADREATGAMLDAKGLILCSNSDFSVNRLRRDASATPSDIKVLVGEDTEGLPARLVARDSELDLAWLQISEAGERSFSAVEIGEIAEVVVGESLFAVSRLDKFFDRAFAVRQTRVSAIVNKPRRVYIPTTPLAEFGLPVYNASGRLVGFTTVLRPDRDEQDASGRIQAAAVILPASDVLSATQRAREVANNGAEGE